jgi:hypothetical protein
MARHGSLGRQTVVIGPPVTTEWLRRCSPHHGGVGCLQSPLRPHALNTEACLQCTPPQYPPPSRDTRHPQWPRYVPPLCTPYPLRRNYVQGIFPTICHHLFFLMTTCHLTRCSHCLAVRSLWLADFWLRTADSLVQTCT